MMNLQQIEYACETSAPLDPTRHVCDAPALSLCRRFYPLGFPVEVRTNSEEILSLCGEMFCFFEQRFETHAIRADVHVVEGESAECPPTPRCRIMQPLITTVADSDNYSVVNLASSRTHIVIAGSTLRHPLYLRYFFLEAIASPHIATRYTTPVHGACVVLDDSGVLLCGDSGTGKTSLSWACARAGWGYVTDDASYLLNYAGESKVVGNSHQVRFRPSAAELFPEIAARSITPRAEGKPSIELSTAAVPQVTRLPGADVDFIVFLNRCWDGPPQLVPYPREVARRYMRQVLFGIPELLAVQYAVIERLLSAARIFELRYKSLDWAENRLRRLVQDGR